MWLRVQIKGTNNIQWYFDNFPIKAFSGTIFKCLTFYGMNAFDQFSIIWYEVMCIRHQLEKVDRPSLYLMQINSHKLYIWRH